MSSADFDVKIKLIILVSIGILILLGILLGLLHRDRHFSKYLVGPLGVIVVLVAILGSLLTIHQ